MHRTKKRKHWKEKERRIKMTSTINTQPLMTNQHLTYGSTVREWNLNLKPKIKPWNSKKLGINLSNLYTAYMIANRYGYSFDNIITYLVDQTRIRTDYLEFTPDPRHYLDHQQNPARLKSDLIEFGHQPKLSNETIDQLVAIQLQAGICTVREIIDAMTYQFVHNKNHQIQLTINQSDDIQQAWKTIQNNTITGDYPKLHIADAADITKLGKNMREARNNEQ